VAVGAGDRSAGILELRVVILMNSLAYYSGRSPVVVVVTVADSCDTLPSGLGIYYAQHYLVLSAYLLS